ncbi:hypothetical protein M407DRAFT_17974 [Tulasnella calospora MUT 4182]|uniref:F-box domain-containing protein n=1 Tax=Tulasnella calospora MUT 4182 TaxID=1051891 RepID=A0A0C3LGK7_9AGAM|nr:hypothetical protein M407DRAFT_17974 [Tulasnella calospora MUT 4182]
MVSTRGKKIKFDLDSSEGELDGERDVEGPVAKPAPKRRRTKQSKPSEDDPAFNPGSSSSKGKEKETSDQNQLITRRNTKGGKLRDLMNMPVDIFTEVCFYLNPYDLRRLALTSKRLWDILMTKEARHIWKTAIASVPDLPICPTDLNEPQYVCLLYSSECYTIGCTSRGTKADWFHRVRFCASCHAEKMTNDYTLRYRESTLNLGLSYRTLCQIKDCFDSQPVMRLANKYRRSNSRQRGWPRVNDEPYYYIDALKKAGHELDTLAQKEARDYLSRLGEMRGYRAKTGAAMLKWKYSQLASRAGDIATEKNARFESIKVKLLDMGWEDKDFPMSNKEFRDLVSLIRGLSIVVWQNIKPKLEPLLESSRNQRLEIEKRQRRNNREDAITKFYTQLGLEVMNLPFEHYRLSSLLPKIEEISALPSIKSLLDNDTETVTEEQWIEVAPIARLLVLTWWRDCLKQLAARLEDGATGSADKTKKRTKATKPKAETIEEVSISIEDLRAKLSYTTAVFSCEKCSSKPARVCWFPHAIEHVLLCHYYTSMDEFLNKLQPLQPNGQELVNRLLKELGLDPETAKSDPPVQNQNEKNLLCTRCDERVARYMSLNEMIEHYLQAQTWFDNVTEAIRTSPDACYPSRTVKSELPKIVNDHDWASRDALLVRQDDKETKDAVLKLQSDFRKEGLTDPLCDTMGIGGQDLEKNTWREVLRCCLLCPKSYGPYPCSTGKIELHIRWKHDKEPDLEKDTTLERTYSSSTCPL